MNIKIALQLVRHAVIGSTFFLGPYCSSKYVTCCRTFSKNKHFYSKTYDVSSNDSVDLGDDVIPTNVGQALLESKIF
jgi:hypothetical protein